jgi:glucose-6-phosphate isomerase
MPEQQIKLYYKNVMADAIGTEHGMPKTELDNLAVKIKPLICGLKDEITGARTRYGNLPFDNSIATNVKGLAASLKDRCENLVVLGIGGSALGNIALQTALNPCMYNLDDQKRSGPRLFVFDNIDPDQFASFLNWANDKLDKTVFNVISKSGRTAETAGQFLIVRQLLMDKLGPDSCKNQVVVTTGFGKDDNDQPSTLLKIAAADKLPTLEVPEHVGGRFSVLSAVGLFSAEMCGIDIESLLEGARDMDARITCEEFYENPAAIIAAINYYFYSHGKKISVMMPYSCHLKDLADWYRQLWAESLGKKDDLTKTKVVHIGPTPVKALGVTDQHSQLQLYLEGPNDKLITFLQVEEFDKDLTIGPAPESAPELGFLAGKKLSQLLNSEKTATEYALRQSKRPSLTIIFPRVCTHTVGQFIYLYEAATSLTARLFDINAYDQPAVELIKQATFALMGKPGYEDLGNQIRP